MILIYLVIMPLLFLALVLRLGIQPLDDWAQEEALPEGSAVATSLDALLIPGIVKTILVVVFLLLVHYFAFDFSWLFLIALGFFVIRSLRF